MPAPDMLHVICHRPGLIRGGHANPAAASYKPGHFTAEQLAELAGEPQITLIVGHTPDGEELDAYVKKAKAAKAAGESK